MGIGLHIVVSKKYGLNPLPMCCPICGEKNGFEEAVGAVLRFACEHCEMEFFMPPGAALPIRCHHCGCNKFKNRGEKSMASMSVPSPFLCESCLGIERDIEKEVAAGGLRWACGECMAFGALSRESEFTIEYRERYGKQTVDFTGTGKCPNCGRGDETG